MNLGPNSVCDKMDENVQTGLDCKLRGGNENFMLFLLLSIAFALCVVFQTTLILFAYIFA